MNSVDNRIAIAHYLYLLDEAFEGVGIEESGESHSLLVNLRTVGADEWHRKPMGGTRSICDIVIHVGACKYMYGDHAFGSASLDWADALVDPWGPQAQPSKDEVLAWLSEGQRRFREQVAALRDDDLLQPRRANWGEMKETRWLIKTIVEHDVYHAGEINHIRALLQDNDRWRHDMMMQP